MRNKRFSALACVRLALALLLAIGAATFLGPCVHADGAYGACHWAGRALTGLGIVLSAQALLALLFTDAKIREGISLSIVPAALLAALTPGVVMPLCMVETMRCNLVTRPAALVLAVFIAVLSAVDAALRHRGARQVRAA